MHARQLLTCLILAPLAAFAQTEGTLQKVKSTGVITLGVRDSSAPLSYALGSTKYVGYHVELCERIVAKLFPQASVRYQAAAAQSRIPLIQNATVDMECGSTSNTAARKQQVAFAYTTYITEARFAVKANSGIDSVAQLKNKTIVTTTGTTLVQRLRKLEREGLPFKLILAKDHSDSMLSLEQGRADAFAMDDNTLAGNIAATTRPADYKIVGEPLGREPISIMLRLDNNEFRDAVNRQITAMMASGELKALYDKWFMSPIPPRNTNINIPFPDSLKTAFAAPNDKPAEAYETK